MPQLIFMLFIFIAFIDRSLLKTEISGSTDDEDLFVPTHEWQVVKKGQKIPKALHVRINLKTGLTEAKILGNENENESKAVVEIPNDDSAPNLNSENINGLVFSEAKLKRALKNIKNDDVSKKDKISRTKESFRSYEEIKKDLGDINLSPKADVEILRDLINEHKSVGNLDTKLHILEDLEFFVHQFDNANEFVKLNGFKEVIYKNLNATEIKVRQESLKLLGSSVQNNLQVQIHAFETGAVQILLRLLALDSDYGVKSRAIFALGAILRRFPLAQLQFINQAGLSVFTEQLEKANDLKTQLKITTLINDLIIEHKHVLNDVKNINFSENDRQYSQINLKEKLREYNWCESLNNLLINVMKIDSSDADSIEKCLSAIYSIIDMCNSNSSNNIAKIVQRIMSHYKSLAVTEHQGSDDNFYSESVELCNKILKQVSYKFKSEL